MSQFNSNIELYDKVKAVPENAKKPITAGRLKGMTDINPMWRIRILTEQFGICGIGWKYTIKKKEMVEGANGTVCAFVDIDLFVRVDGEWSDAIEGTGGSQFVAKESAGLYTNDECYKMALTDALSVACKSLGIGSDVYWQINGNKYDDKQKSEEKGKKSTKQENKPTEIKCPNCGKALPKEIKMQSGKILTAEAFLTKYKKCPTCIKAEKEKQTAKTVDINSI